MDIPRWRILFILKENGESSISEISIHAIAKLSTITKIVYRMKADGLVETNTSASDGRVTQVSSPISAAIPSKKSSTAPAISSAPVSKA